MAHKLLRIGVPAALAIVILAAQAVKSPFVGTVVALSGALEIELRLDGGPHVVVKLKPESAVQRVAPGEKDLKNARPIQPSDIAQGDRVLVNLFPDSMDVRRIVVMPAAAIAKRDAEDRQDWLKRGVAGVVVSKSEHQIVLKTRSMAGEQRITVNLVPGTKFSRYAPDSIRFADARASSLPEINEGDQVRARGVKSADGLTVEADQVVSGAFLTKAGEIKSVDAEAKQVVIQDLATGKPLIVQVAADSQLKKMPDLPAMPGGAPPPGGMPGSFAGPRPGPMPDMNQMLEWMPKATLDDLKPGQTIVVSSTKGAAADRVTAIMLLANADMLVRMAMAQPGANKAAGAQAGGTGGMPALNGGGLAGLEMPGMVP